MEAFPPVEGELARGRALAPAVATPARPCPPAPARQRERACLSLRGLCWGRDSTLPLRQKHLQMGTPLPGAFRGAGTRVHRASGAPHRCYVSWLQVFCRRREAAPLSLGPRPGRNDTFASRCVFPVARPVAPPGTVSRGSCRMAIFRGGRGRRTLSLASHLKRARESASPTFSSTSPTRPWASTFASRSLPKTSLA
jgi:hypothetical protein